MGTVLLGMSGGIDSSVAIIELQKMGYKVIGLTLRLWSQQDDFNNTVLPQYLIDAKETAAKFNISHKIVDVRKEFYDKVISYFKDEYISGRTPNPCAKCNVVLKWEVLNREAIKNNCSFISTGHYVNKEEVDGKFYISKGVDPDKEQSFFLWGLNQEIIKKAIFPLGKMNKTEVRKIALENNLIKVEKKKESTGICFLNGDYQPFLKEILKSEGIETPTGNFVNQEGKVLGHHSGYPYYTVGQRRGLGLVPTEPLYITQINAETNEIILGNKTSLYKNQMIVKNYNLINTDDFNEEVITRIRYRKQAAESSIKILDSDTLLVEFTEPEWSIAPGQTAAFYFGDRLLGGGFIQQ